MSFQAAGNANPGAFDRRVRLDYPIRRRTASGSTATTWVAGVTVWASKVIDRSGKLAAGEATHIEDVATFRIRARNDIVQGWRLVHGDDVYDVTGITELGRGHYFDLSCRALDQSAHSAVSAFLTHDNLPLALHASGATLNLHREADAA